MGDEVSGKDSGPGWLPFDLLGAPVPANKGCKGRPQHAPTAENLEKLILLSAKGHTDVELAAAIGLSVETMKLHYFATPELQRAKRNARMLTEGELLARLNEQSKAGKVAATDKLMKRLDLAATDRRVKDRGKPDKAKPKGKKEIENEAAGAVAGRFATREAPPRLIN